MRLLSAWIKFHQIFVSFETANHCFFKFCTNLQCHETQLSVLFYLKFYILSTKGVIKVQFGEIESLEFGTVMGSLRQNNIKSQLKKYRRVIFHEQSLKKKWLVVSNITWGILWIFTQPLKSFKILLQWAIFVQSIRFELKHTEELSFMTLSSDAKFE